MNVKNASPVAKTFHGTIAHPPISAVTSCLRLRFMYFGNSEWITSASGVGAGPQEKDRHVPTMIHPNAQNQTEVCPENCMQALPNCPIKVMRAVSNEHRQRRHTCIAAKQRRQVEVYTPPDNVDFCEIRGPPPPALHNHCLSSKEVTQAGWRAKTGAQLNDKVEEHSIPNQNQASTILNTMTKMGDDTSSYLLTNGRDSSQKSRPERALKQLDNAMGKNTLEQDKTLAAELRDAYEVISLPYITGRQLKSEQFFDLRKATKDILACKSSKANRGYFTIGGEQASFSAGPSKNAAEREKETFEIGNDSDPLYPEHWPNENNIPGFKEADFAYH
ncbi:hypothetical protein DFS33DRAFT_1275879 [Desarmillaria ectypa]|nr:hypothetical protein DFS33DRAFT_1275879 [Desarmillaria ectypa]